MVEQFRCKILFIKRKSFELLPAEYANLAGSILIKKTYLIEDEKNQSYYINRPGICNHASHFCLFEQTRKLYLVAIPGSELGKNRAL